MKILYNEWDKNAAQWLRNLVAAGQIAEGDINDGDIKQLTAESLAGYKQCHFFAGIGGWPLALRLAGWPGDREAWTASCPCQPFSCAGRGGGFTDERDLWPVLFPLISERNPEVVFGEQVASKAGLLWLDRVYADLEGAGYAVAAFDLCAAGVSAPHIRQRLYWVAYRMPRGGHVGDRSRKMAGAENGQTQARQGVTKAGAPVSGLGSGNNAGGSGGSGGERGGMVHPVQQGLEGHSGNVVGEQKPGREREEAGRPASETGCCGDGLGHSERMGLSGSDGGRAREESTHRRENYRLPNSGSIRLQRTTGETKTLIKRGAETEWGATFATWADNTTRRFEPGILPLAHGVPGRVGQIRGYGNAIVPPLAAEFVKAFLEVNS